MTFAMSKFDRITNSLISLQDVNFVLWLLEYIRRSFLISFEETKFIIAVNWIFHASEF